MASHVDVHDYSAEVTGLSRQQLHIIIKANDLIANSKLKDFLFCKQNSGQVTLQGTQRRFCVERHVMLFERIQEVDRV